MAHILDQDEGAGLAFILYGFKLELNENFVDFIGGSPTFVGRGIH